MFQGLVKLVLSVAVVSGSALAQSVQTPFEQNLLLGKAGAAGPATLDTILINPAHLGGLPESGVQLGWGIRNQQYQQRYPGFPTHSSSDSGLEDFPSPSGAYKVNRKFGVTGIAIPFPFEIDISKQGLPLIVLGQESKIDLSGKGQLDGLFSGAVGYSFSPLFSIGASFSYLAFSGNFSVTESTSVEPLIEGAISAQNMTASIGIKSKPGRKFSVGLVVTAITQSTLNLNITGGSLNNIQLDSAGGNQGGASPAPQLGGEQSNNSFANPIRLGLAFRASSKITVLADVDYKRKSEQKQFSFVDLAEKPVDNYDVISVFSGVQIDLPSRRNIFVGYRNQPSEIGPGSQGVDGTVGFGFANLLNNLGGPPATPVWAISAGYRQEFGKKLTRKRNSKKQMFGEVGFIYQEVSIGIDENGEQPGAYLVRDIRIPFKFGYRF